MKLQRYEKVDLTMRMVYVAIAMYFLLVCGAFAFDRTEAEKRADVIAEASKMVGIVEATGRNDGPAIERMLHFVGANKGDPYCAAFVSWIFHLARLDNTVPRSAWSPDMVKRPTWTRANGGVEPKPGDTFGIYFPRKGRVAHTGIVQKWGPSVTTIEANTSPEAVPGSAQDRDGGGIWRKHRLRSQIHSVRNWLSR